MPSLSRSGGGGGQPLVLGSSVLTPGVSGHASSASSTPSLSRSGGGGGQPLVLGSSVLTPGVSGHASSGSSTPSPSRSAGGAGGGGIACTHSIDASTLSCGVPKPRVSPGPMPAPSRTSSPIVK